MTRDSAEISLINLAIEKALSKGASFYAYRAPDSDIAHFGAAESDNNGKSGFMVHPFSPEDEPIIISADYNAQEYLNASETDSNCGLKQITDTCSTTKQQHISALEATIKKIRRNQLTKVVISRTEYHEHEFSAEFWSKVFARLVKNYPKQFVFIFNSQATGAWIGATPEKFLKCKDNKVETMALAGTQPLGTAAPWSQKDVTEQAIVRDYILKNLQNCGIQNITQRTYTKPAGSIEHICTEFSGELETSTNIDALLKALHPTPAICGMPKDAAYKHIIATETHQRTFYGGYIGPYNNSLDFDLYVNLRSLTFDNQGYLIFAGGGIIADSDPLAEWEETERKISNIKQYLNI